MKGDFFSKFSIFSRLFGREGSGVEDYESFIVVSGVHVDVARLYAYGLSVNLNRNSKSKNDQEKGGGKQVGGRRRAEEAKTKDDDNLCNLKTLILPKEFMHPSLEVLNVQKGLVYKDVLAKLASYGYERVDTIYQAMQFMQKGDSVTIFTNLDSQIIRLEFFGDELEKISLVDFTTLRSNKEIENFILININPEVKSFDPEIIGDGKKYSPKIIIFNPEVTHEQLTAYSYVPFFHGNTEVFARFVSKEEYQDYEFFYSGKNWENIRSFRNTLKTLQQTDLQNLDIPFTLERGFIHVPSKTVLLTDREVLSSLNLEKAKSKYSSKFKKLFDNEVKVGDYVVHEAHGVGQYIGIETKVVVDEVKDFVVVSYKNEDRLLVPFEQLYRISKYISASGDEPKLTKLGTTEWAVVQRKLKKAVENIAKDLLAIYAKKSMQKGIKFKSDNTQDIHKIEENFGYELTDDQLKTLNEVKADMESDKPMERLIIGDVGFGKTEIAIRAAYKAVHSKKQVLILAPTTILVTQLYEVFSRRFSSMGVNVERVSRFDGTKNNKSAIAKANKGQIDIIIGTHRLLGKDVQIKKLGLLIVDEEQRFGVTQKEKIRQLKTNIDMLSMSATPIPRTLQMALTGVKDISIIATPPSGRKAVHTELKFHDEVANCIMEEYKRKGQVFIVHNRVSSIAQFVEDLKKALPKKVRVTYAHGQMAPAKLEEVMYEFANREHDVLVATTIIENGIDIPTVNTMIIDDAHNFGLSQLYQLRGRVGRSDISANCYLVVPKVKEFIKLHRNPNIDLRNLEKILEENKVNDSWITFGSVERIKAIIQNQELGAGFKIASRDLEIRGSGNILGSEQSGHINAVGYEMFIRLLEQHVNLIRTSKT